MPTPDANINMVTRWIFCRWQAVPSRNNIRRCRIRSENVSSCQTSSRARRKRFVVLDEIVLNKWQTRESADSKQID